MAHDAGKVTGLVDHSKAASGISLKLVLWTLTLASAVGASIAWSTPAWLTGSAVVASLSAASTTGYLVAFTYCLVRVRQGVISGWFLYSFGFGLLFISSFTATILALIGFSLNNITGKIEIMQSVSPLFGVVLIVFAGRIARARAHGQPAAAWKTYARTIMALTLLYMIWRSGLLDKMSNVLYKASSTTHLVIAIGMTAMLAAFVLGARKSRRVAHDELTGPMLYWAMALIVGSIASCIFWRQPHVVLLQTRSLEILSIAALLIGLNSASEGLQREAIEKMSDLDAMQKISWSLVGATTLDELCSAFANAIADGFSAGPVVVYLADEEGYDLNVAAVSASHDSTVVVGKKCSLRPERRPGFHNGHTSSAFKSGSIETTTEIHSDTEFMSWREVARQDGLVVSVPLPHQGHVIGVVNLFLPETKSLGESRTKLLTSVAAAVAPAIENARLHADDDVELKLAA